MSREVRITIDDDEVFEHMKRRKRELDLSWKEVLQRGLYRSDAGPASEPAGRARGDASWAGDEAHDRRWDRFADSVEDQVQRKVYNALRGTFGAAGIEVPEPPGVLDPEMADLAAAEDAVLAFEFLDDDPAYQVPLRLNLETSADGLSVDVVAVRHGKSVRGMNAFDARTRQAVTSRLAEGATAELRFDDGAEGYDVEPVLRWGRDDAGRPTVTEVRIEAVRLPGADAG